MEEGPDAVTGTVDGRNKRQRTTSPNGACGPHNIAHLPDEALAHAASYLAPPSRAMFAVAMTAPPSSWRKLGGARPSATGGAILGSSANWEALDFEDVEKNLAAKLRDDDVAAILSCINAKDKLRKLKLSGCVNISGEGLNPLHYSLRLEHIDLSLVGQHERPRLESVPLLSEDVVLPILQSIIGVSGSSLRLLVLPKKWQEDANLDLCVFLREYRNYLGRRGERCSNCDKLRFELVELSPSASYLGTQHYVCGKCTKNLCRKDDNPDPILRAPGSSACSLTLCTCCEKRYCLECEPRQCQSCCLCVGCTRTSTKCECGKYFCEACYFTCKQCGTSGCRECADFPNVCEHDDCDVAYCRNCVDEGFGDELVACGDCHDAFCPDCRLDLPGGHYDCEDCKRIANHYVLQKEKKELEVEMERLVEANKRQREEIERQRQQIEVLEAENEELRRK